ncbi:MAG: hypothetical protein H7Y00_16660 [Fimbriimonadaceae bacterium]|nr:hypothetical protein [Chitinophagales bacterium]
MEENYIPKTEQEAWVGILFSCMASDMKLQDIETDVFTQTITKKEIFKSVLILPVYRDIMFAHSKAGSKGLIDICKSKISIDYTKTLFAIACEIVFADGKEAYMEDDMLHYLADALQIIKADKEKIIEVIRIKNKGNKLVEM